MAESFEERLVKAVKEHTHLYDTSMRLHFDKEALEHSWREIATYLNSDPDTCRKKWRLARDRHVRALKKSKDMPEGVPRPGSLSWLTVFIKHRQTNPNFPEISADRVESPNDNLDQTPLFSDQAAFMWQVAQERNVMHYGKLEEFVTLVTEMVPELLSSRQRTQLILGLRARMVLELFRNENPPDPQTIQLHLDRIKTSSVHAVNEDSQSRNELEASESNFVELVKTLLEDPSEKKHFFQVVFPIRYGPRYDTALQILVWEFLSRLEELLPVPDLTETASCLSLAPSDLEEFWHSVSDPEHLKTLLQHHRHLGHLSKNEFSNQVADNILSTLSIPQIHGLKSSLDGHEGMKGSTEGWKINSEEDQEEGGELHFEKNLEDDGSERNEDTERGLKDEDDANWTSPLSEPEDSAELDSGMPSQVFSCPQCPFSHREMVDLHQHIRKEHLTEEDSRSLDSGGVENSLPSSQTAKSSSAKSSSAKRINKNTCKQCGKGFRCTTDLKRHQSVHTSVQPFRCNQCEKRFKSERYLQLHKKSHDVEPMHRPICQHCGKSYTSAAVLKIHIRTHTGERPYSCSVCGKKFNQKHTLVRHLRMHKGERPYLCSVCGKAFFVSGELLVHMRFHTGERPYRCKPCGKAFSTSCALTSHKRWHSNERPFTCSLCSKGFAETGGLKRHMFIHTEEKPHYCHTCGKGFSQLSNMRIHLKTHKK
ncbi:zinc finger protein 37 homolog isoform X2 [Salmo salar]|uniref:Zinc finger protein 37 homolog isoform X2 n=1 Tax=Salmo salar TaxID=8030 RepID=A0A1S3N1V4_SALSA|nr:zinc finger protein 37 homolog isoform X2 [Salmo salar]|eukprot:XP_014008996.1 PREDICTED: zinc finger protein 37 homolog isoform X2 [Salmo salar]